jgi:hypothetical protein
MVCVVCMAMYGYVCVWYVWYGTVWYGIVLPCFFFYLYILGRTGQNPWILWPSKG